MVASLSSKVLNCERAFTDLTMSYGNVLLIEQGPFIFSIQHQLSNDHRESKRGIPRVAEKSLLCRIDCLVNVMFLTVADADSFKKANRSHSGDIFARLEKHTRTVPHGMQHGAPPSPRKGVFLCPILAEMI